MANIECCLEPSPLHVLSADDAVPSSSGVASSGVVDPRDLKVIGPDFFHVVRHYVFLEPPASPVPEEFVEMEPRVIPLGVFGDSVEHGVDRCTICLGDLKSSDTVVSLVTCGHWQFHYGCGLEWLNTSGRCPVCREVCHVGPIQLCEPMSVVDAKAVSNLPREKRDELIEEFKSHIPEAGFVCQESDVIVLDWDDNDQESDSGGAEDSDDMDDDELPDIVPTAPSSLTAPHVNNGATHRPLPGTIERDLSAAMSGRRLCNRIRSIYRSLNRHICDGILPDVRSVRHTNRRTRYQFCAINQINLFVKRGSPATEIMSVARLIPGLMDEYLLNVEDGFGEMVINYVESLM